MKKLTILAGASLVALNLAACGATDTPAVDIKHLSVGETNQVASGGYWWTYVDKGGVSTVTPNTGLSIVGDRKSPLNGGLADGAGAGIEPDENGNKAIHVTGVISATPAPVPPDTYWDELFGNQALVGLQGSPTTGEQKYPAAGLGFGFQGGNAVIDLSKYAGIRFRMKLGATHGTDTAGVPYGVRLSVPTDYTDVPDSAFADKFGQLLPTGIMGPICTFTNSKVDALGNASSAPDAKQTLSKTCFGNYFYEMLLPTKDQWVNQCVTWAMINPPTDFAKPLAKVPFDPRRIIKVQWDAHQAKSAPAAFDIWVDDVELVDCAEAAAACPGSPVPANCSGGAAAAAPASTM